MKAKSILSIVVSLAVWLPSVVLASAPIAIDPVGTNIIDANGTVYMIATENGQTVRRPYTSAGAFLSYGFNSFAQLSANAYGFTYPLGSFIPPQDGKIICSDRGMDTGTCYLISQAQRYPFPSETVFAQQGFSFNHVLYGDVSFLPLGGIIQNPSQVHNPGVIINKDGTIYFVGNNNELRGFPSADVFTGWGYSYADAVLANTADRALLATSVLQSRPAGILSPFEISSNQAVVPSLTSLSPSSGPVGTAVAITGTGFTNTGNSVSLDGFAFSAVNLASADGQTLFFTIPSFLSPNCTASQVCPQYAMQITPGNYSVMVTNTNGTSNGLAFTVTSGQAAAPTISSLSSTSGAVGTVITVTGSGFISDTRISFGNSILGSQSSVISSLDGKTFTFTIPSTIVPPGPVCVPPMYCAQAAPRTVVPGNYNIFVANSNGTSNSQVFIVTASQTTAPTITSLSPSSGSIGTAVVITGSEFVSAGNTVSFGNFQIASNLSSGDGKTLYFTVPSTLAPHCSPNVACPQYIISVTPADYAVTVTNTNGTSNAVTFTVTN